MGNDGQGRFARLRVRAPWRAWRNNRLSFDSSAVDRGNGVDKAMGAVGVSASAAANIEGGSYVDRGVLTEGTGVDSSGDSKSKRVNKTANEMGFEVTTTILGAKQF